MQPGTIAVANDGGEQVFKGMKSDKIFYFHYSRNPNVIVAELATSGDAVVSSTNYGYVRLNELSPNEEADVEI